VKISKPIGYARVPAIHRRLSPPSATRSGRTPPDRGVDDLDYRFDVSAVERVHKTL
jgi:hypothetical protein